jgi:succinoglycan biosynthesis protein ExoA
MTSVSVIIPCYNEEATICSLLEAIHRQTYPMEDIEVIIADGLSEDATRAKIRAYSGQHPDLQINVIDNIRRSIPSGVNRAIEASRGKYLIRMDAHSIPDMDYIKNCVAGLDQGLGDNVGGVWIIEPKENTWIARSIALAVSHRIGIGDALYRTGGKAQEVDTVPFGAFKRELVERIGMFDETLLTNEDYEFNVRVRQAGGKVWMDPSIHSIYQPRSTLKELSRQYWRYGYWKAQMLRRYPGTLRWRQALPPLFVLTLIGLAILAIGFALARWLLAIIVIVYILIILITGIQLSIKRKDSLIAIGMPLAIITLHLTWGTALLWGLVARPNSHQIQAQ